MISEYLKSFGSFIGRHYGAIFLALAVGLISIGPQLMFAFHLGSAYHGIPLLSLDDEEVYLSEIQEVLDGHGLVSSPIFYEYKNQWPLIMPWGVYLYAAPAWLLGISAVKMLLIGKFLFPALLFLLAYSLIYLLTSSSDSFGRKFNALAGGLLVALGFNFLDLHFLWLMLSGQFKEPYQLLWARPVNPIAGALFLFSFLTLVWLIISRRRNIFWLLTAGLIWGMSLCYFFSWGLCSAIVGVLIVIFLCQKNYQRIKDLFIVAGVSLVVTLPYWYNVWVSLSAAGGSVMAERNGMFFTHGYIINKLWLLVSAGFLPLLVFEYRKNKGRLADWWWFCLAISLGGWLVYNQQIVTGRTIWPHHFVQFTIPLAMVLFFILLFNYAKPKFEWLWWLIVVAVFIGCGLYGYRLVDSYRYGLVRFGERQRYASVFSWINANAAKDCVVLANTVELARMVPAFTHCNIYESTYNFYGLPLERVWHNYLVFLRVKGVDPKTIDAYLSVSESEVRGLFYTDWNQVYTPSNNAWVPAVAARIAQRYREFAANDFAAELKKYRLDYILLDGQLSPGLKSLLPEIKLIKTFDSLSLYSF